MDNGETNGNQGHARLSEISDYEFIALPRSHTPTGEATWIPNQVTSTAQKKPYSYREPSYNLNPSSEEFKPSQPYHTQSFPMSNTNRSNAEAVTELGKKKCQTYLLNDLTQAPRSRI